MGAVTTLQATGESGILQKWKTARGKRLFQDLRGKHLPIQQKWPGRFRRYQCYVRHADHNNERRGIDTDEHHQPMTQTRRHHDKDHRKQQTTVSSHHQKERTPSDRHESNGGSHRDSQKRTQANHPHPLEAPWTFQEPNNHNGWGLFPGAVGYYPPWGIEFSRLNTADHCNMAFSVRPPPDWTGLTPQYDHTPSVPPPPPLPMAAGDTTSCTLENPSIVAQENDTPSLSASSSQTTESAPPTVTRAPAVENHKQSATVPERQQSVCHNRRQSHWKHQQQSINPTPLPPVPLWNWVSPVTQKTRQSLTSFYAGDKKMALQRTTIRLPHSRNCCHQKQRGQQKDNAKQRRHQRRHRNMQQRQLRYHSRQPRNNIQKRQIILTGRNLIIITTQRRRRNLIIITTQRRRRNLIIITTQRRRRNLIIITTQRRRRNLIIITTQRRRRNLQRMTSTPMLLKTHRPNQRQQLTRHQRQRATPQPRHSRHVTHPGNPCLLHETHAPK